MEESALREKESKERGSGRRSTLVAASAVIGLGLAFGVSACESKFLPLVDGVGDAAAAFETSDGPDGRPAGDAVEEPEPGRAVEDGSGPDSEVAPDGVETDGGIEPESDPGPEGEPNGAPVFEEVADLVVTEGSKVEFTLTAADPDGEPVAYLLVGGPDGVGVELGSGKVGWTPGYDTVSLEEGEKVFELVFRAIDPHQPPGAAELTVVVTVRNDEDQDGVADADDGCPELADPEQLDFDEDGKGDGCDVCPGDPEDDGDGDGVCAGDDVCAEVADPGQEDSDGDGVGDACDTCAADPGNDLDEDGLGDACDVCPADPGNDSDGDGVCGDVDLCPEVADPGQEDSDADGKGDLCDPCPKDPDDDADGDGACAGEDVCPLVSDPGQEDGDKDGLGNACDPCPADPKNDADDDGFCSNEDTCPVASDPGQEDADQDGAGDACDVCPKDPLDDADLDGECGDADVCPDAFDPEQGDSDGDGLGDACDGCPLDPFDDADGDGVCGDEDVCPNDDDPEQLDTDFDGAGDACDACPLDPLDDPDGDEVCGEIDLCPDVPDPAQKDSDGDGAGDACDLCPFDAEDDPDEDGVCGDVDLCPGVPDPDQLDLDGDGKGDFCDEDLDGDSFPNSADVCPADFDPAQGDLDGDGAGDVCDPDDDGDGADDDVDVCPFLVDPDQEDCDGDGLGDACTVDDDGDGTADPEDCAPCDASIPSAAEACDGEDDDCDGETDEGFDVYSEVESCGACGHACEHPTVAEWTCRHGVCEVDACVLGQKDKDGNGENGCEVKVPVLHVDAELGDDLTGNGTAAEPLQTIPAALSKAAQDTVVFLHPGTYEGGVTMAKANVTLLGSGTFETTVAAPSGGTAIVVAASGVAVRELGTTGGTGGIRIEGAPDKPLADVRIETVRIAVVTPAKGVSASGLVAVHTAGLRVEDLDVVTLEGGDGTDTASKSGVPGAPGSAVGVDVSNAFGCHLLDVTVTGVRGGAGGKSFWTGSGGQPGTPGGDATGIRLSSVSTCTVESSRIYYLEGGAGGVGGLLLGGEPGGAAVGLDAEALTAVRVFDLDVYELVAGAGAHATACADGGDGGAASAIRSSGGASLEVRNVAASAVDAGAPGNGIDCGLPGYGAGGQLGVSSCVDLASTSFAAGGLRHLTCHGVGPAVSDGAGVRVDPESGSVAVADSIVSTVTGPCLSGPTAATYTHLHACSGGFTEGGVLGSGVASADPKLAAPADGDLHLLPTSTAIDAATPSAPFCLEPTPNGGRADLGAYGNTPGATPKPGAAHVPCLPGPCEASPESCNGADDDCDDLVDEDFDLTGLGGCP